MEAAYGDPPTYATGTVETKKINIGEKSRNFGVKSRGFGVIEGIRQKQDRIWEAKVTDIDYNTVAPI